MGAKYKLLSLLVISVMISTIAISACSYYDPNPYSFRHIFTTEDPDLVKLEVINHNTDDKWNETINRLTGEKVQDSDPAIVEDYKLSFEFVEDQYTSNVYFDNGTVVPHSKQDKSILQNLTVYWVLQSNSSLLVNYSISYPHEFPISFLVDGAEEYVHIIYSLNNNRVGGNTVTYDTNSKTTTNTSLEFDSWGPSFLYQDSNGLNVYEQPSGCCYCISEQYFKFDRNGSELIQKIQLWEIGTTDTRISSFISISDTSLKLSSFNYVTLEEHTVKLSFGEETGSSTTDPLQFFSFIFFVAIIIPSLLRHKRR